MDLASAARHRRVPLSSLAPKMVSCRSFSKVCGAGRRAQAWERGGSSRWVREGGVGGTPPAQQFVHLQQDKNSPHHQGMVAGSCPRQEGSPHSTTGSTVWQQT